MANIRPEGLLNIPVLVKPDRESIKTRPKAVNAWIARLPQADPSHYARKLYDFLKEINKLDIPKKDRLYILLILRTPLANITETFKRQFTIDNIPLSPKNQAIFELTIELNIEMALAYKILIEQTWTQKLTLLNKKHCTELLYWGIHYLSEILLISYQIYTEHPVNTWVDLHQFFLYAEENDLEDIKISDDREQVAFQESCISSRYKQIVLLGLISPFRLRQQTIEKVYLALENWNEYCIVKSVDEYTRQKHQILLRLNSDLTPGFYLSDKAYNRDYTRVLDTEQLEHLLSEHLIQSVNRGMDITFTDIPAETVKFLLVTWSGKSKRSFVRKPTDNQLQISIGVKATHLFISTANREHHEFKEQNQDTEAYSNPNTDTVRLNTPKIKLADTVELTGITREANNPQPELSLEAWSDNNPHQQYTPTVVVASDAPDIWDPTYTSKSIGYDENIRDWLDTKTTENIQPQTQAQQRKYENVNESASGHCLICHVPYDRKPDNLQIGDIVGLRKIKGTANSPVGLGLIRRLKHVGDNIDLGIQKLAPVARAIELSQFHPMASRRKFKRALLLPSIKSVNQPVTIVSGENYRMADALILNQNGQQSLIKISKLLESTGAIVQYEFRFEKQLGFTNEMENIEEPEFETDPTWSLT